MMYFNNKAIKIILYTLLILGKYDFLSGTHLFQVLFPILKGCIEIDQQSLNMNTQKQRSVTGEEANTHQCS